MVARWLFWTLGVGVCSVACRGALRPPEPLPGVSTASITDPQPSKRIDLRGKRLVVVMTDAFTARLANTTSGWQQFLFRDGKVFDTFQKLTGFIPEVVPPVGCTFKNSSCNPTLDVLGGVADLTFNTDYVEPKSLAGDWWLAKPMEVDWSPAVHVGHTSVVMASSKGQSALSTLADGVEAASVVALLAAVAMGAFVWRAATPAPQPSLPAAACKVLAFMVSVPTPNSQPISSITARLLVITCSLFSIVFVCIFQGVLVESMTNIRNEHQIETLQELDESEYGILASSPFYARAVRGSNSVLLNRLNAKLQLRLQYLYDEVGLLDWLSGTRNVAVLITHVAFQVLAPITKTGPSSFHEAQEHPSMYFQAYPSRTDSPYAERLREVTGWLLQSGLIQVWYEESIKGFVNEFRQISTRERFVEGDYSATESTNYKTTHLEDFVSVFILVAYSYGGAAMILLLEIAISRRWFIKIQLIFLRYSRPCQRGVCDRVT